MNKLIPKLILTIAAVLYSTIILAQGIVFEQGAFSMIVDKAKQLNKPIFIDVYTSWCGPCKTMDKDVFPQPEVGKHFNENYICYKVNAEKKENAEIVKKYNVKACPTYLYIKPDGTIFFKAVGKMNAENFINKSKQALNEMKSSKSISRWEKEFNERKEDPQFILEYMKKRTTLGLSNVVLLDKYLEIVPEEKQISDFILKIYREEQNKIKQSSIAFENLQKHREKFPHQLYYEILRNVSMETLDEAINKKDENLLLISMKLYDELARLNEFPEDYPFPKISTLLTKEQMYLRYYSLTENVEMYLKYANKFCNNKLMKIPVDSLLKKDKRNLKLVQNLLTTDERFMHMDSTQKIPIVKYFSSAESFKVSAALNSTAWYILQNTSDKRILKNVLNWSNRALQLTPNNPHWLMTNANLHYKLGNRGIAIKRGELSLKNAQEIEPNELNRLNENLEKMKTRKKIW